MEIRVKGNTKKGQGLLEKARVNLGTKLRDVYDRYSEAKEEAMDDCKRWCEETGGSNFRIISHCRNFFSVAWEYNDPETGEMMTRIETANNTYIIDGSR